MALDPRIALSVQPLQLENPMARYAQMAQIQQAGNQNALAQYQLSAAQRAEEKANALGEAYRAAYNPETGGIDNKGLFNALAQRGLGASIPEVQKSIGEAEAQRLTQEKTKTEIFKGVMEQRREMLSGINPNDPNAPEMLKQWSAGNHENPFLREILSGYGVQQGHADAKIDEAARQGPQAVAALIQEMKLGATEFAKLYSKQHYVTQDTGTRTQVIAMPENAIPGTAAIAAPVAGSAATKTLTPGEAASNAVARGNLALSQQRFAFEQANPGFDFRETESGLVAVNKRTGQSRPVTDASGQPLADSGRPLTETQGKAAGFGLRMESAEKAIAKATGSSSPDAWEKWLAGTAARGATSEQAQQVRQAQANWVRANLRLESGAVIGPDEMQEEINTYFPKFGDGPKVIEQKRQARLDAQAAVKTAASPAGMRAVRKTREALEASQSSRPQPTAPSIDALLDKYK